LSTPATGGVNTSGGAFGASVPAGSGAVSLVHPALTVYDVDFGAVPVGSSRTAFLGIQNLGDPDSAIAGRFPVASGPFSGGGRTFFALRPGEIRAEMYTFAPVSAAPASQALTVVSDAGNVQVTLRGNSGCYANCDASTTAPVLNVGDFTCFLQKYANGCP
jgi:hypothetical protein